MKRLLLAPLILALSSCALIPRNLKQAEEACNAWDAKLDGINKTMQEGKRFCVKDTSYSDGNNFKGYEIKNGKAVLVKKFPFKVISANEVTKLNAKFKQCRIKNKDEIDLYGFAEKCQKINSDIESLKKILLEQL